MIKLSEILKGWKDYGGGTEHQIFTSDKNPNVIYKVGKKDTVLKWSEVFKSNPKIFPKVYKVGKLKDGRYYAEIEKLNTDKVVKDWGDLEQALELIGVVDTDVFEDTIDQAFINILSGHLDVGKVYTDLASNKKIQALFKKWIEFLSDATEYVENSVNLSDKESEKWLKLVDGGLQWGVLSKEEFINKCKTDNEFSEKWGLKIEERELRYEERIKLYEEKTNLSTTYILSVKETLDKHNIPTRLITITYKEQTIESYE